MKVDIQKAINNLTHIESELYDLDGSEITRDESNIINNAIVSIIDAKQALEMVLKMSE